MVGVVNSRYSLLLLREIEGLEEAILRIQRMMEPIISQAQKASLSVVLLSLVAKGVELFSLIPQVKKELSQQPDRDKEGNIIKEEEEEEGDYNDDEEYETDLFLQTPWGLMGESVPSPPISNKGGDNEGDDFSEEEQEVDQMRKDRECKSNRAVNFQGVGYDFSSTSKRPIKIEPQEVGEEETWMTTTTEDEDNEAEGLFLSMEDNSSSAANSNRDGNGVYRPPLPKSTTSPNGSGVGGRKVGGGGGLLNFPCPVCRKKFRRKGDLTRHLLTHEHEPEKPFGCDFCSQRFAAKSSLQKHLVDLHNTDPKPFECDICQSCFTLKKELDQHAQTHSQDSFIPRSFLCIHCKLKFITQKDLNAHMEDQHPEVSYKCGQCNKTFPRRYNLLRHVKSHSKKNKMNNSCFSFSIPRCDCCGVRIQARDIVTIQSCNHRVCRTCIDVMLTNQACQVERCGSHVAVEDIRTSDGHPNLIGSFTGTAFEVAEGRWVRKNTICDICENEFGSSSARNNHREFHFGPYPCLEPGCTKEYDYVTNLNNHQKKYNH